MDKIFKLSFKFGKIFTGFLLILLIISMIGSGIYTIKSFKKIELTYPTFYVSSANEKTQSKQDKSVKKPAYMATVDEIAKAMDMNQFGKGILMEFVNGVSVEQKEEFVTGLKDYLISYNVYVQTNNKETTGEALYKTLDKYQTEFLTNWQLRELERTKQKISEIVGGSIFVSSILLFILCLIIPLLIKIEENTRK